MKTLPQTLTNLYTTPLPFGNPVRHDYGGGKNSAENFFGNLCRSRLTRTRCNGDTHGCSGPPGRENQHRKIGNNTWIHSEPLRLKDLKGQLVLLEFWTYG